MLLALPSSLTFGSPGTNGSTFPVCVCGLLKFDAYAKLLTDIATIILMRIFLKLIIIKGVEVDI